MRQKSPQGHIFDNKKLYKRRSIWIVILLLVYLAKTNDLIKWSNIYIERPLHCNSFDVVYTWVNGSDPEFIKLAKKYGSFLDPARFDDKNELKYSLRSLQKFAPWVNHVYIVTNGQIPYWLNLEYDGISVVSHNTLAIEDDDLPTFSSSSIETFIHRIPNLSKRFLYLNDDIFLGENLYPEDLYTAADGVKIYAAWLVPDCAPECPWVYIGDGACDPNCNIEACQFDGNDCLHEEESNSEETNFPTVKQLFYDVPKSKPDFVVAKRNSTKDNVIRRKSNKRSFNEVIKHRNTTDIKELKKFVEKFNRDQTRKNKRRKTRSTSVAEPEIISSKDIYAQSLVHTNKILNKAYGFKSRKVLAHVGFLLDRDIVQSMLEKFPKEFQTTMSHRFRHPQDMQFAFTYFHFIMSEQEKLTIGEIFDIFDTDNSSTWSDREIRTLLARLYPLPLDWSVVKYFEDVLTNCSHQLRVDKNDELQYTTFIYERYEDSNLPTVTKNLVLSCIPLVDALQGNFGKRGKYKFNINHKTGIYNNFKMLTSNITEVINSLDEFRRNPKKFNCINDNLEPQFEEENQLIKYLLEDFYLSFFPKPSKFELPHHYRNRFLYITDYEEWKERKYFTLMAAYILFALLCSVGLKYCCSHKAKYARKLIPYKYCDI